MAPHHRDQQNLFGDCLAETECTAPSDDERARPDPKRAVLDALKTPWSVWGGTSRADRIARRYLRRYPEHDRPDPDYDLLTDRQAATEYHLEEEALEAAYEQP